MYEKCGFTGCPGDAQITADVEALIQSIPGAASRPNLVYVQTLDHVVYLTGQVNTEAGARPGEVGCPPGSGREASGQLDQPGLSGPIAAHKLLPSSPWSIAGRAVSEYT